MADDISEEMHMADSDTGKSRRRRLPLGQILQQQGLLTRRQVEHILDVQAVTNRPFGDLAERLFGVEAHVVADAWVRQFVAENEPEDVCHVTCEARWLKMLDRRQAWQFRIVPLRREQDHLLIAAEERGLLKAVNFAGSAFPITPCFVLAEPRSLQALLMRHYPVPQHLADYAFGR